MLGYSLRLRNDAALSETGAGQPLVVQVMIFPVEPQRSRNAD